MRKILEKVPAWAWWALGVAIVVTWAWLTLWNFNERGMRLDQVVGDPVMGFSKKQWGELLSGVIGAVVGGIVAVGVLGGTVRAQSRWTRDQLTQAKRQSEEQLRQAAEHHREALAAQAKQFEISQSRETERQLEERALEATWQWATTASSIDIHLELSPSAFTELDRKLFWPIRGLTRGTSATQVLALVATDVAFMLREIYESGARAKLNSVERDEVTEAVQAIVTNFMFWDMGGSEINETVFASMIESLEAVNAILRGHGFERELSAPKWREYVVRKGETTA